MWRGGGYIRSGVVVGGSDVGGDMNRVVVFAFAHSIGRGGHGGPMTGSGESVEQVTGGAARAVCCSCIGPIPKPATSEQGEGDRRLRVSVDFFGLARRRMNGPKGVTGWGGGRL